MKQVAKKFLKRMVNEKCFIANGIQDNYPRLWYTNQRHSSSLMNVLVYDYLISHGYIIKDKQNKYIISRRGKEFITPWYKRMF